MTAAAFALGGCRHSFAPGVLSPTISALDRCSLPPVHVSADREIRTIVGLRPHRPSGFVVRAEKTSETLVVHNYGHGGGGITLSWGTAKLAVDLGAPGQTGQVAVLGCGAVGLATARLLQEAGLRVTIYAKDLPPNTTSNVAGGQWYPFGVFDSGHETSEFMEQFVKTAAFSYRRYQTMQSPRYAVRWMRNFALANQAWREISLRGLQSPIRPFLPELRDLRPREHPFTGYQYVRQFDTMLIEPPIYLSALMQDFREAGGEIVVRDFPSISSVLTLRLPLVFNCTGLGARALFGDQELVPVRGQLTFLLPQPEVDYAVLFEDLYMFPRSDGILLGGTHETGNWSLLPDEETKLRILNGHRTLFENMRRC